VIRRAETGRPGGEDHQCREWTVRMKPPTPALTGRLTIMRPSTIAVIQNHRLNELRHAFARFVGAWQM
jgi:hypothetical protein